MSKRRYLFKLSATTGGKAFVVRGLRQLVVIGASLPALLHQVDEVARSNRSPTWRFPDGAIGWKIRRRHP